MKVELRKAPCLCMNCEIGIVNYENTIIKIILYVKVNERII